MNTDEVGATVSVHQDVRNRHLSRDRGVNRLGGGSEIGLELPRRLAVSNDVIIASRSTDKLRLAHQGDRRLTPVQLDVRSETSAAAVIDWP